MITIETQFAQIQVELKQISNNLFDCHQSFDTIKRKNKALDSRIYRMQKKMQKSVDRSN